MATVRITFGSGPSRIERVPNDDPTVPLKLVLTDGVNRYTQEDYAGWRADVIFEPRAILDPIEVGADDAFPGSSHLSDRKFLGVAKAPPFHVVPSTFLKRARAIKPEHPEANASAFANWVYSIYGTPGDGDADAMKQGLAAESAILEARGPRHGARALISSCDNLQLATSRPDWEMVHCGLHLDPEFDRVPFFELDALAVHGRPLRASPDLVFRNRLTGEVIIVEVKMSRQPLPPNLWPNVWAQLWCYANIPVARSAPRITVVAEIWGELYSYGVQKVFLRSSARRDPRGTAYDRFFTALFDIYSGRTL